jgi:PAS domain S-box-containing protein
MPDASILIVEDEVIIAQDLKQKLESLGYQKPRICTSGEEAIEAIKSRVPDLILMDIRLKGTLSGIDTAERIHQTLDIPVIFLTAHADTKTLEQAKQSLPYGYLVKPLEDERSLYASIEIALHKHRIENLLREREAWFASTLQTIEDAVITTDQSGHVTVINPKAQLLTGISNTGEDIANLDQRINLQPNRKPILFSEWIHQTIKKRETRYLPENTRLVHPKGQIYDIEGSLSPIISTDHEVSGIVFSFRDISERKKMEYRLRKTLFSLDHVGEGAFWIRQDASIEDINETACNMLNYDRETLLRMTFIGIDTNQTQSNWDLHWEMLKKNKTSVIETYVRARDGREFPVEVISTYIVYHHEEYDFTIIRDISERQKNIQALRDSQRKLSLFARNFRGVAYQVQVTDKNEYIISYLEGDLERITGYRAELFQSGQMHWNQLIHPDDIQKVQEEDQKIVATPGYTADTEYRIIKKDGTIRWVRDIARIIEEEDTPLFQGSIFDISERVQAEQALRESEEKYRSLVELANDGILILQKDHIRFANNRVFAMLDLPATRVLNKSWTHFVVPEDEAIVRDYYKKRLKGEIKSKHLEIRIQLKNNRRLPVEISAGRITFNKEQAILVYVRDISERKKAELAMQRAQRTYQLASLGTLAAGISHEINQPLTALKVKVDGLLYWGEEHPEILQKNLKKNLQFISQQADAINSIIRHMRSLIHQEKSPSTPIKVNFIVQKACSFIEQRLNSHGIVLKMSLTSKNPTVWAIETPLEQVVLNLVTNAIHALDRVDIEKKVVEVRTSVRNESCLIQIMDNGPGIPEDHLGRIFDPLFTTEQNGKGMGLGLAIVEELLRQFKATVKAHNRKQGGVVMTVQIPLLKP